MAYPISAPSHGPFTADQLHDGDRYELSQGHPIYCAPAGGDHAGINSVGASVIDSDPAVRWTGVDAGFSPEPGTLRAPDVAVASPEAAATLGWIPGVPPLAVEYASRGQDEPNLQQKIRDLLKHGTRIIWVVRLIGPRRVEIYTPDEPMRLARAGEQLLAPGILQNPLPVEALYDREAGRAVMLRNLLQRQGFADLDAVLEQGYAQGWKEGEQKGLAEGESRGRKAGLKDGMSKGREKGRKEGRKEGKQEGQASLLGLLLKTRFGELSPATEERLTGATTTQLEHWATRVMTATDADDVFRD